MATPTAATITPPSVIWISERASDTWRKRLRIQAISTSSTATTVYSTLELFERMGVVRRIAAGPGPALYDPRVDEHQHLVCTRCGRVDDLDAGVDSASALRAARRSGFEPSGAELVVSGLCARCAAGRPV